VFTPFHKPPYPYPYGRSVDETTTSAAAGCQNKKLDVERDEIMNRFST
jgi:hypothetical protein